MTMQSDQGTLTIGGSIIPYTVVRSSRRQRTVNLALQSETGLTIQAPEATALMTIERLIRRRMGWLTQRLADIHAVERERIVREYINGETVRYLGRQYRLRIIQAEVPYADCKLYGRWMTVRLPSDASDRPSLVAYTLREWYEVHARKRLPERAEIWSSRLGVTFNRLLVSDQEKRWGSCDTQQNLRINWRVIMAPISLIDYVLAHEVCHLVHADHSDAFWRLLATVMPDYERRKQALKELGSGYTL